MDGIFGHNRSDGTDRLLAVYGGDVIRVSNGAGYGQNLTPDVKAEFEAFLDRAWFVNGTDKNRYFNGTTWTSTGNSVDFPLAKYIKRFRTRLYVADINYLSTDYDSRVWYSDLPDNNDITWGYETHDNLQQTLDSAVVRAPGALFKSKNIKVGDPFTITTGPNAGEYKVASIDSETQITLTENLATSDPADTYWVGGNWFDVATNDNDIIYGFGENSDRLLIFKRESFFRFDGNTLRQVKGYPGTTSGRSVVNVRGWTFWFHPTGIWRYDGSEAVLISRAIQDYIDGISATNYADIVAWRVGEKLRMYVGDISNSDADITLDNAYLEYDTVTQTWTPGTYGKALTCATTFIESSAQNIYLGDDDDEVFQDDTGNSDDTSPINWRGETGWHFPQGTQAELEFTRAFVHAKRGRGINVKYKLYGPKGEDKEWRPLNDLEDSFTVLRMSPREGTFGRGINFLFIESSTNKPPVIERIDQFYRIRTLRALP